MLTDVNLDLNSEDEASEVDPLVEEHIGPLKESLISFHLSGLNEELRRDGQSFDIPASDNNSVVQSPTYEPEEMAYIQGQGCKKKKMPEYDTITGTSDLSDSDGTMSKEEPPELRLESAKRALKSTNERLCRSSRQENPIIRYGYNECMAHYYVYMTKVAEI